MDRKTYNLIWILVALSSIAFPNPVMRTLNTTFLVVGVAWMAIDIWRMR
jgi:hypothetical protein